MRLFLRNTFLSKAFLLFLLSITVFFSCDTPNKEPATPKLFTSIPSQESGLDFFNELVETVDLNYYVYMDNYIGGGIASADFNNDGLIDLYFVSNTHQDKLYLNQGNLKFKDITGGSGIVNQSGFQSGVAVADINGDGFLDIYISRGGWEEDKFANLLYINNGDLTFTEDAKERGLDDMNRTIHATFFDYDNDGDLDVYNLNSPDFKKKEEEILDLVGVQSDPRTFEAKGYDKLFRNDGNGFFTDVSAEAGILPDVGFGLNAQVSDINGDGWLDIYVCNDFRVPDFFFINNCDGTFTDKRNELLKHMSFNSMGGDIADVNNDGLLDIYTLDMNPDDYFRYITTMGRTPVDMFHEMVEKDYHHQYMHNVLQINNGPNGFSEISNMAGVANTDWSWATLMADFDLDGFNDIFVTNGVYRDVIDRDALREILNILRANQRKPTPEDFLQFTQLIPQTKLVNYFFRNRGDLTFENTSNTWTDSYATFSNGAIYADLDNDGDLDIVVSNLDEEATLLKNNAIEQNAGNYLELVFQGPEKNTKGVGVVAKLFMSDGTIQIRELINTRGFISSVSNKLHFGLHQANSIEKLEICWQDGMKQIIESPNSNQLLQIDYKDAKATQTDATTTDELLFEKKKIDIVHEEFVYNDYKKQALLPQLLSQTGPAFAVADVNNDGSEDVYVGGAYPYEGVLISKSKTGTFISKRQIAFAEDSLFEDVGATFFDADNDGDQDLYVVSGSYEYVPSHAYLQDRLYLNDGKGNFKRDMEALPEMFEAGSMVKAADFDQDGDLDLFVGGRVIPGKYPHTPKSYLLVNDKGKFSNVTTSLAPGIEKVGMVNDAQWVDLDLDGDVDLVVTGEWMGIEVFTNESGKLTKENHFKYLSDQVGWWNRILIEDIDADGDMDIIAGNLGLNTKFTASSKEPFHVYSNDFDNNGTEDVFLVKYYQGKQVPIRGWSSAAEQLPRLNQIFASFHDYANANLEEILGPNIDQALHYEATEFRSGIFFQNESGFEFQPFDNEVQIAPINAIVYQDIDEDGIKDLILAGNNYVTETQTTRYDAGIGIFLKGLGAGEFQFIHNSASGLYIDKDVRNIGMVGNDLFVVNNNDILEVYSVNR